jgi:hypothetical protein
MAASSKKPSLFVSLLLLLLLLVSAAVHGDGAQPAAAADARDTAVTAGTLFRLSQVQKLN